MAAYMIVDIEVIDPGKYERYKELAPPSIAQYGGRYLARGGKTETMEGSWSPKRLVILEFPSMDRARAWWASKEYAEAKALRQACAKTGMLLLEGMPGPLG
jgi:uncharacterized protein (DUF1330 family)